MRPFHKVSLCGLIAGLLSCNSGDNTAPPKTDYTLPYRLDQPDAILELPAELREISGLSLSADGRQLLAVNDEQGKIFFLNPETGAIERSLDFGGKGDYEGIEAVGNDIYVVKSNGTLYRIPEMGAAETLKTALDAEYDVEGLGYDPVQHRLLLACKGRAGKGDQFSHKKAVYAFDLVTRLLAETPAFLIDRAEIAQWKGAPAGFANKLSEFFDSSKAASAFNPSGIAYCPQDNHLYLIASAGKTLAVLHPDGRLLYACRLNPDLFRQPEGICFGRDGTLYIASEGGKSGGRLLLFKRM
jgi:uncharacterized protein YjiK